VNCCHANHLLTLRQGTVDLDLADLLWVGDKLLMEALIGFDHCWQLVTGKVIQKENSLTAIHTHLGWVISGSICGNSVSLHTSHSLHTVNQATHLIIWITLSKHFGN